MKLNSTIFIFLIALILSQSSCYKHEEGCRDINALNFDVAADNDCKTDCCKYPEVNLNITMFYDTIKIDTNTFFPNGIGDSVRIKSLRMYLSEFALYNENKEKVIIKQEITIGNISGNITTFENINFTTAKISEKNINHKLGTLDKLDKYNKVNFNFGLASEVNHSNIDKIPVYSPLYQSSDSMHIKETNEYYFLKLEIEIKSFENKQFYIVGDNNLNELFVEGTIDFTKRENHTLALKLDLKKWFEEINFKNDTELNVLKQLIKNLNKSFILF